MAAPLFEGTEKKVELTIDPALPSLRERGDEYWQLVARSAGADVLSKLGGKGCDAYLLSESSLFVFDHKFIMITCGRTHPPTAVLELLKSVPAEQVGFLVYERKNEAFPHDQPTSFFDDVALLNRVLPGRAFQFGDGGEHQLLLYHLDRAFPGIPEDRTVEILMYGIDDEVRACFETPRDPETRVIRERTGVDRIVPGFECDDHLFDPPGYSLNASRDDEYWTVHVTLHPSYSYASFETNHRPPGGLEALTRNVLEVFRPRAFDLVVFDQGQNAGFAAERYQLRDHVVQDLDCGYSVRFMSFFLPSRDARRPIELSI